MFKKPKFAVTVVNIYIIAFLIILQINISNQLEQAMFIVAPFVSMWMFYVVIAYSNYSALSKQKLVHHNDQDLY